MKKDGPSDLFRKESISSENNNKLPKQRRRRRNSFIRGKCNKIKDIIKNSKRKKKDVKHIPEKEIKTQDYSPKVELFDVIIKRREPIVSLEQETSYFDIKSNELHATIHQAISDNTCFETHLVKNLQEKDLPQANRDLILNILESVKSNPPTSSNADTQLKNGVSTSNSLKSNVSIMDQSTMMGFECSMNDMINSLRQYFSLLKKYVCKIKINKENLSKEFIETDPLFKSALSSDLDFGLLDQQLDKLKNSLLLRNEEIKIISQERDLMFPNKKKGCNPDLLTSVKKFLLCD